MNTVAVNGTMPHREVDITVMSKNQKNKSMVLKTDNGEYECAAVKGRGHYVEYKVKVNGKVVYTHVWNWRMNDELSQLTSGTLEHVFRTAIDKYENYEKSWN